MKYLVLLLILTACAQPKILKLPPSALDPKYFKRDKLYPYIYLKDGYIEYPAFAPWNRQHNIYPPLPEAGNVYWGNAESFTNTYGQLTLKIPVKLKNVGKVLAYTNQWGVVIVNDAEVLVPPQEFAKLIDAYPSFFKHYEYDDMFFAYTNFAERFYKEVTNIYQLQNNAKNVVQSAKEFWEHTLYIETNGHYTNQYSPLSYVEAAFTFTNHYIPPEESLRICQVKGVYRSLVYYLAESINMEKADIPEVPEEFGIKALPLDDLQKFYNTVLNLFWLALYNMEDPEPASLTFPSVIRDPSITPLMENWPDFSKE